MPQARANGLDLEYESFGRESDPAILLIMGFAAQMTMWPVSLCQGLADLGFRVIRFDNRDFGKSTHLFDLGAPNPMEAMAKLMSGQPVTGAPYELEDMAKDAVGLLDALGIERAHIVGASMGGMIAQIVAAKHGDRTKSLVSIMSTTGRRDLPPGKPEAMTVLVTPPASDSREDRIAQGKRIWRTIGSPGYPATEEELNAVVEREVDRVPMEPTGAARQLFAIVVAPPRNEILSKVRCPALVLHGGDDPLFAIECAKDTATSIPGAQLVIVPGMGHDFSEALLPIYLKHVGGFISAAEHAKAA
jgi:pimeloyl-ACP methyl ester carboxylesterase